MSRRVPALVAVALLLIAAAKAPIAGSLKRTALPGGWILEVHGEREHLAVEVHETRGAPSLVLTSITDAGFKKLDSAATIVDGAGGVVRRQSLGGLRPVTASLARNAQGAAVLATSFSDPDAAPTLLAFDAKGGSWKAAAPKGDVGVLHGGAWIALHERSGREAARFFRAGGDPLVPPDPIAGAMARAGEGLASVADGKLSLYDPKLVRRASAPLGFAAGQPFAAADGSLVAVAEVDAKDGPGRALALFDRAGKALGRVDFRALSLDAAVAPDGSAVLVAPSAIGRTTVLDDADGLAIVALDRTGKRRWQHTVDPRSPTEHVAWLGISGGGSRAVAALRVPDGSVPERLLVFDASGKVVYSAEGVLRGLWLDEKGESLFTVEPGALSRLRIDALIAKKAFP